MLANPAVHAGPGSFRLKALLPGEQGSSAQLTPTKHGLHPRQRSRSDARRVSSCRRQLNLYGIAPCAPWSAPRIGGLCTRLGLV